MKGGGGVTGITRKKPVCNVPVLLGGRCASKIPQSRALVEEDSPFCRENTRVGVILVAVETLEYGQEGIKGFSHSKGGSAQVFLH